MVRMSKIDIVGRIRTLVVKCKFSNMMRGASTVTSTHYQEARRSSEKYFYYFYKCIILRSKYSTPRKLMQEEKKNEHEQAKYCCTVVVLTPVSSDSHNLETRKTWRRGGDNCPTLACITVTKMAIMFGAG